MTALQSNRWFPTTEQLKDPAATERAFRQVLTQLYALQDKVNAMQAPTKTASPTTGSGPADTMLLGLHVAPVDTTTLANGATLKWNKASGHFEFS